MNIRRLLLTLFTLLAFAPLGRADEFTLNSVDSQNIQINNEPAHLTVITSIGTSTLIEEGATRLKLKGKGSTEQTQISAAGESFKAPLSVFKDPIKQIPWVIRQLIGLTHPMAYHQFKKLYLQITQRFDGALGWPEIRDNILVFDGAQNLIRRVEQVPPETAGWLKLRIVPDRCLLLEVPLANGGTGTIWIDTADNRGVALPPAQWNEWKKANPSTRVSSDKKIGIPLFVVTHHHAEAAEIKLGPLTLTDVPIAEMDADSVGRLRDDTPKAKAVWSLGTAALSRMDLVVDWARDCACLHPKPPIGGANPVAVNTNNWRLAAEARIARDNFHLYSGEAKWGARDLKGALAELNQAIALNPRNTDALSDRGSIEEIQGNFTNAVADYDKVIATWPDYSDWERLYRQSLLWRLDSSPEAEAKPAATPKTSADSAATLQPVVVRGVATEWKDDWARTIGLFLGGSIDAKALLAEAKKGGDDADDRKAVASYYVGMMCLSKGDKTGARDWFKKSQSADPSDREYYFTRAESARLNSAGH